MLWWSCCRLSLTPDEPAHFVAGCEYWQTGKPDLYNVNPPLVRLWSTWPVASVPLPESEFLPYARHRTSREEFKRGAEFVDLHGPRALEWVIVARRMCAVFALLGTIGVFGLTASLLNWRCGIVAAAVWAFNPNVLGHASILSCDIPAATMGVLTSLAGLLAWRHISYSRTILTGTILGLTILTKLTWIVAPFLLVVSLVVLRCTTPVRLREASLRTIGWHLLTLFAVCWLVVCSGYRWQRTMEPLGSFQFVSEALRGDTEESFGNRFVGSFIENARVPLPAAMLEGIDQQWQDFDVPRDCYLAGKWQKGGWYYYYLVALSVKLPLGLFGLLLLSALSLLEFSPIRRHRILVLCGLPVIVLFVLVSVKTNMNEHTRYLWVTLPYLSAAAAYRTRSVLRRRLSLLCMGWIVAAGLLSAPYGISYANELFGGSANTWRMLTGSNADWSHGWVAARDWLERQPRGNNYVLSQPQLGHTRSFGIPLAQTPPPNIDESGKVIVLISTYDRMLLQRRGLLTDVRPQEVIGGCVEVYDTHLEEIPFFGNVAWVEPRS